MTFLTVDLCDGGRPKISLRVNSKYVMIPSELTCLLAQNMDVPRGSVVADLGCGCGILSIIAAKLGAKLVYAVDINPHALNDTRFNAKINGVSKAIRPLLCDIRNITLMMENKIDIVVCNPPQTPVKYQTRKGKWLSLAQDGGITGRSLLDSIITQSPRMFNEKQSTQRLELVITSLLGISATSDRLKHFGFSPSIVANTLVRFATNDRYPRHDDKKNRTRDILCVRAVVIHANYHHSGVGSSRTRNSDRLLSERHSTKTLLRSRVFLCR